VSALLALDEVVVNTTLSIDATQSSTCGIQVPEEHISWDLPLWYAAYTSANHEKRVAEQLAARALEHFLPLYETVRHRKDRKVRLQLPLFPGYLFVRIPLRNRLRVQQVPGVARLVGFDGTPVALPDGEVESLRRSLANGMIVTPHSFLKVGSRVRFRRGPLEGISGILLRRKGKFRVVISIDLIQRSVAVDADAADVEPVAGLVTSK